MSPSSSEPRRPGAYSVSTEPQGQPEMLQLKIPANTQPGTTFSFAVGNRRGLTARCPPSCQPGDTVRVAVQPPGTTQYTLLKMANLTATDSKAGGGAMKMTPQVLRANHELLAVDSKSFLVTVPPSVQPGMQFVARTPHGQQFLVTCPKNAGPNQQIRMMIPKQEEAQDFSTNQTKIFEVIAPEGALPNQVLPVLVCGKRIPITLPSNIVPGQKLKLKVPVQDVLGSIELSYDEKSSAGWYRTIRMSDLKFQWVRVDQELHDDNDNYNDSPWHTFTKKTAFVRKLIHLQGNDARMPTGHIDLAPPDQAVVESELVHDNHRTLVSYAAVAHIQGRPLEEKTLWFQNICSELTAPWESGRIKIVGKNLVLSLGNPGHMFNFRPPRRLIIYTPVRS
jgi:hypothetical protein